MDAELRRPDSPNKSLLAERGAANLAPPEGLKADWTFDQWRAVLKALTKQTGDATRDTFGTAFLGTTTWYYEMMYLWGNGAEIYNKDETKVVVNSPEGVAGLQMLVDVQFRDRLAARIRRTWTWRRRRSCSTPRRPA